MSEYSTRNRLILVKEETTVGTDAVPTPAANAIRLRNPTLTPQLNTVASNEDVGSLDDGANIPTTATSTFRAQALMRGGGNPGVTLPPVTPFLKAAGLAVTTLAADVTGTAQSGAVGTITLAVGASAVDDLYRGAVIQITAGTGVGQTRMIPGYVGSSKLASITPNWTVTPDATSVYAIRKNHIFKPTSSAIPTLSIYQYDFRRDGQNPKLQKLLGGAATVSLNLAVSELCYFDVTVTGLMVNDTDPVAPAAGTFATTNPIPLQGALLGHLDGVLLKVRSFGVDLGNQVAQVQNVHAAFGLDSGIITGRDLNGTLSSPRLLQSERDVVTSWQNGTESRFAIAWGNVSGNRFALLVDKMVYTGKTPTDVNSLIYEDTPFSINGVNDGMLLCFW